MSESVSVEKAVKEPLVHITKRAELPFWKRMLVRVAAVFCAFLLCGILAFVLIPKIGQNPARIGEFYKCFIDGSFKSGSYVWTALKDLAVLLCISLAVTPAFRMKFWNIGGEGQTLVGVLAAEGLAYWFGGKMAEPLLLLLMFAAALAAGALWGFIPAFLKARWDTNETLITLMMNYVATFLVTYCLAKWVTDGSMVMRKLEYGVLPSFGNPYLLVILIVVLLTIGLYVYLNYSKHGYEISVVGESVNTAKYIGIDVKKVIIRTMIMSGALCGFAGFLIGAGLNNSVATTSVDGRVFTAIMVSWLAKFSPVFMLVTAGLIVFLQRGASEVMSVFDVTGALTDIFVGLTLFFIIGCEFFLNYQMHFRKSQKEVVAQ